MTETNKIHPEQLSWSQAGLLHSTEVVSADFFADPRFLLNDAQRDYDAYYGLDHFRGIPGVEQRMAKLQVHGFEIVCQSFQPIRSKGSVLIVHGYFDHSGLYGNLIGHLLRKRYSVLCFDLPGHGLSSGDRVGIERFAQYQNVLLGVVAQFKPLLPAPLHAIGQSTGGAILIDYLLLNRQTPDNFEHIVLMAPLIRPRGWKHIKRLHRLFGSFFERWPRRWRNVKQNQTFVDFVKYRDPLQSDEVAVSWVNALIDWVAKIEAAAARDRKVLIIQGDQDGTVAWEHNLTVLKEKLRCSIRLINNAEHHLVNEPLESRQSILTSVSDYLDGALS